MTTTLTDTALLTRLTAIQGQIAKGQLQEAATALNDAQRAAPGDARILATGSMLAEASGNLQGALDMAQRACLAAPTWAVSILALAKLQARMLKFDEALTSAKKAVSLAGGDAGALAQAIAIADAAQHTDLSLQWLQQLDVLHPGRREVRKRIANNLRHLARYEEAQALYGELAKSDPYDGGPLLGHAQCAISLGRLDVAREDTQSLLELEPDNATYRFWHQVANSQVPTTQPREMVERLHDANPNAYDFHMVRGLEYAVPQKVAATIRERYTDLDINILDLGCGTGLLGVFLGRIKGFLIGVDVSAKSVALAARHDVYDRFHTVNLVDALAETPPALYDVITACDVFVYVGDLSTVIPNAFRVLKPGGHLIFSCEAAGSDDANFVLRSTVRYAHKKAHIKKLCKAAGFTDIDITDMTLRLENQVPETGYLVVARKPLG